MEKGDFTIQRTVAQKAGNKGVWPKKKVNEPLLKPAMFCRTLCRGQNLGILPSPFTKYLENPLAKLPVKKMPFRCPYIHLKVD